MNKKEYSKIYNQLGRLQRNPHVLKKDREIITKIRKKYHDLKNDSFKEKYYIEQLNEISKYSNKRLNLDSPDFDLALDESGLYTSNLAHFLWLTELNDAFYTLEENNINVLELKVYNYQDFINLANNL